MKRVSKWKQFKILKDDEDIFPFLPKTHKLTRKSFSSTIKEFSQVIIKPNWGKMGCHVIQVSLIEEDLFEIHYRSNKITLEGRDPTYAYLKGNYLTKRFVVQQKIPLASIYCCPFDLRVMVQRARNSSEWAVTGRVAKVAYEGYIITNVVQNILPVEIAIEKSCLREISVQDLLSNIDRLVLLAATRFQKVYPSCHMIGFDIGIDDKGEIWIIEANFQPLITIFKLLEDKSMYLTIKRYKMNK